MLPFDPQLDLRGQTLEHTQLSQRRNQHQQKPTKSPTRRKGNVERHLDQGHGGDCFRKTNRIVASRRVATSAEMRLQQGIRVEDMTDACRSTPGRQHTAQCSITICDVSTDRAPKKVLARCHYNLKFAHDMLQLAPSWHHTRASTLSIQLAL